MELTRKQVIEILDLVKKQYHPFNINQQRLICALDYAISSLKTDLKYDLMYEGEDIYTKADMIAMFEDLKLEIEKIAEEVKNYDVKWALGLFFAKKIIQDKINALKDNPDKNND